MLFLCCPISLPPTPHQFIIIYSDCVWKSYLGMKTVGVGQRGGGRRDTKQPADSIHR